MQAHWFPQVDADIFLSHSHADEELALRLAGWAWRSFDLKVFIDSSIWGNSADLLKIIDDKYCRNDDGKTYSYEKRNSSTSHVHMMLATALAMMIDKTECAWVLDTGNSLTSQGAIAQTQSPWLFSEIATLHHMRRRTAEAHRAEKTKLAKRLDDAMVARLKVLYAVPLESLTPLDSKKLNAWKERHDQQLGARAHALDLLYAVAPE